MADDIKYTKVLLHGDYGVGKTSIVRRFVEHVEGDFVPNIANGRHFVRRITIDGIKHDIIIWDLLPCGGWWSPEGVGRIHYIGTTATLLVYDVTNRKSYDSLLDKWLTGFRIISAVVYPTVIPCIVGTKSDLHDQRQVFREEAEAFARSIGALFFEASARTGENVDKIFEEIARRADWTAHNRRYLPYCV